MSIDGKARPALFDLQINGFYGVDFQRDPPISAVRAACAALRRHKTHHILATFISDRSKNLTQRLALFESYRKADLLIRTTIVGYHLEGPYLSSLPGYRGAHPAAAMKDPDVRELDEWQQAAGGNLRLVTLAPERNGAAEFINVARQRGILVSIGHTDASEYQIDEAINAGASLCTHLGNGCPSLLHRHDNVIQRLAARDELTACLIPDGIHLPPPTFKNLFRAKPPNKVIFTADAMAAAGAAPGKYSLGDLELVVGTDGVVRQPGEANFAGSALTPEVGVERAASMLGLNYLQAWQYASSAVASLFALHLEPVELDTTFPTA